MPFFNFFQIEIYFDVKVNMSTNFHYNPYKKKFVNAIIPPSSVSSNLCSQISEKIKTTNYSVLSITEMSQDIPEKKPSIHIDSYSSPSPILSDINLYQRIQQTQNIISRGHRKKNPDAVHPSKKPLCTTTNNSINNRTLLEQHNLSSNVATIVSNSPSQISNADNTTQILNEDNSFQIDSDINRLILNGNTFYKKYTSKDGHQTTYVCKKNRGLTNSSCTTKIKVLKNSGYIKIGAYGPECEGFENVHTSKSNNATDEMLEIADELAMNHIA